MKNQDMQFTDSMKVAIAFMVKLLGANAPKHLPIPEWKEFSFFEKIRPGRVYSKVLQESGTSQFERLTRKVSFCGYKDVLLAEVWLHGNKFKCYSGEKTWYVTCWRVAKVKYRKNLKAAPPYDEPDWHSVELSFEESPVQ